MADSQTTTQKVLVLDSDTERAEELSHRLRFLNYVPVIASPVDSCGEIHDQSEIAVVLGDTVQPDIRRAFQTVAEQRPDLPVLVIGTDAAPKSVAADLTNRPHWTLNHPVRRTQLCQLLRRAERYQGVERRQRITGNSRPIRQVRRMIEQVAEYDTNVLISGDSGTGKELVARTIHDLSGRAEKPFVAINCGAIPAELIESELFGHRKGAFTGAIRDHAGRFELAEGGTLFLDEIGDMSLDLQVKLLRVLQERKFERVGGTQTRDCDIRFIAATHRNLPDAVANGEFREDLYYRLGVFPIEMPPLYKRASDLPMLLDELLLQHCGQSTGQLRLSEDAIEALTRYAWPGNIRELSNLVERLTILFPEGEIKCSDLPEKYRDPANWVEPVPSQSDDMELANVSLAGAGLKLYLRDIEVDLIKQAMTEANGVVAAAARLLNTRRTTLVEKLAKYQLND